ncbi:CHASE domain-containing protein [Aurantiacibacter sp. D1-12]|uniref:CHASE domain-containing protein n=1 Tax=Aurantiacibacter sp. D1-12 TaxID=2993658 RepID=UPI00237CA825|nr:CHASE domain-containing protein [Aurantiacibacter sp. D1-12]MDE1467160.1 CHASE domain-containing protein [Aurantiacibacter sp. D1-12]
MPVGIFALVAAITILSVFAIERGETQRDAAQLSARTTAIAAALERRANASSAYLRAGAALLSTMDEVPADDFRRFVSELRLDADYRGAEGIGWARVVFPTQVEEFNALVAEQGPGSYELYPGLSGEQAFAVPVTFLQPDTERNRRALGFDMYSEPVRRAAMQEAEEYARPVASGKVVLQQEGNGEAPGFLIYMPVFEAGPGGRQLKGFIYSPFNAQDFLQSALELEDAGSYGVRLYAEDPDQGEESLVASTFDGEMSRLRNVRQTVVIAEHAFVLLVSERRSPGLSGLSMVTLIFGLLVATLLLLLVRMLTQQAKEDESSLTWFEEQASIRNSLTRELNHRVKNTLANVLSIIALTRRRAEDVDEFATSLDGRVRALSATHDLLTQSDWGSTPIRSVVDAELLPYAHGGDHQLQLSGPDIELAPNDALSLGLAVHELATNAGKYGALSQPGGTVSVDWVLASEDLVRVEWLERGGPPVASNRTRGFGTDLIERIVAHELRHPVQLDFDKEGVRCVLMIPVRRPSEFAIRAGKASFDAGR